MSVSSPLASEPRPATRPWRWAPAAAVVLAGVCVGCGASVDPGARLFSASCTGCHTLAGHESGHVSGGDLARRRMTVAEVESFVRVMPLRQTLSAGQVHAVSEYVARAQARLAR